MKGSISLILLVISLVARSQSLEGVYAGRILSEKNAFVISVVQESAIGSVYLSASEKLVFMGSVRGVHLEGTAQSNAIFLEMTGSLIGDSLFLSVKQGGRVEFRKLFRVSKKTNYNATKLVGKASSRDLALVGTWLLLDIFGKDGKRKPKDEFSVGFTYKFFADGSCLKQSPAISKFLNEVKSQPSKTSWDTQDARLFFSSGGGRGSMSYDYGYLLNGDTLILVGKSSKEVYLRYLPRGKAK